MDLRLGAVVQQGNQVLAVQGLVGLGDLRAGAGYLPASSTRNSGRGHDLQPVSRLAWPRCTSRGCPLREVSAARCPSVIGFRVAGAPRQHGSKGGVGDRGLAFPRPCGLWGVRCPPASLGAAPVRRSESARPPRWWAVLRGGRGWRCSPCSTSGTTPEPRPSSTAPICTAPPRHSFGFPRLV